MDRKEVVNEEIGKQLVIKSLPKLRYYIGLIYSLRHYYNKYKQHPIFYPEVNVYASVLSEMYEVLKSFWSQNPFSLLITMDSNHLVFTWVISCWY